MRIWIGAIIAGLALVSCANREQTAQSPPLTERQRDSVLSKSSLPGATVVGRAIAISDKAAKEASEPVPEGEKDVSD